MQTLGIDIKNVDVTKLPMSEGEKRYQKDKDLREGKGLNPLRGMLLPFVIVLFIGLMGYCTRVPESTKHASPNAPAATQPAPEKPDIEH